MEGAEDAVRNAQVVDARARNISHNVRCTECGLTFTSRYCQSPQEGKSNKDIYKKVQDDFEETVLYAPKFDLQTSTLWLLPLLVADLQVLLEEYGLTTSIAA